MKPRREPDVYIGDSRVHRNGSGGKGEIAERDGERYYKISGYHTMSSFLMSVVSGYDHWLFVSSSGGLTCGRRDPETALFPYVTDDKLHDARTTTGPKTVLLVERDEKTMLWLPFETNLAAYHVERNLYKNSSGSKLVFEEINHDLGVVFSYSWTTSQRYGFVRESRLENFESGQVRVELLDGVRNLLPYGVERGAQSEMSTLVDAYKRAEAVEDATAAVYSLSSILSDRAEPSEALKGTVVWCTGLDRPKVLLSEDQVASFSVGKEVDAETFRCGKRGAFFVQTGLTLGANETRRWHLVADVEQGPAQLSQLLREIRDGVGAAEIARDVAAGAERLERLTGAADGFEKSSDALVTGRHFSNVLCNIMRGGVFPYGYRFPREDFLDFVAERNRPLVADVETALGQLDGELTLEKALALSEDDWNDDLRRLVYEYLPLTFSRRHGDPSRPWNHFSIDIKKSNGDEHLHYQGNWRDIFQNWEALAVSFPEYLESFIAKFVNASTPDGHNAYRISRDGIDWETIDPDAPWSNIGYWGDHQVVYLLRLVEMSCRHHPGRLAALLDRDCFVYADVPYRIKPYAELLQEPRGSVVFDDGRADAAMTRVERIGSDGKLVTLRDGSIYKVNLLEKLLVTALAKIGNLVPGGGIWMNTQRPEWNDANNALVGYGLSMVTLCYLRSYLERLTGLVREGSAESYYVSREVTRFFDRVGAVLSDQQSLLEGPVTARGRKAFMDEMGATTDRFRSRVYAGYSGTKRALSKERLIEVLELAIRFVEHSISHGQRKDGLYHAYNLIRFDDGGYPVEHLQEMLEGQVAALASGALNGNESLALLRRLRESRLYREDQNSYLLYPHRQLPSFLEKNVIPLYLLEGSEWALREIAAGRTDYIERGADGRVHFNGRFRNAGDLRAALAADPDVRTADADTLCDAWEAVFNHRQFTGRSGSMYKYEGLGCIYWHMVSKLALATAECASREARTGSDRDVVAQLADAFDDVRSGIGVHKRPSEYGAFPVDPYSHTPGFNGVQQPGLTGQVKEDVIARFAQLGVHVDGGEVVFEPVLLERREFLTEATPWRFTVGAEPREELLQAGSLAFTYCGVPVIYRLADEAGIEVHEEGASPVAIAGARLCRERSASLFRRDGRIAKLVVDLPQDALR